MSGDQVFTLTFATAGIFRRGEYVEVFGTTMRVEHVHGTAVTVRSLRWYERAWLCLTARLKP